MQIELTSIRYEREGRVILEDVDLQITGPALVQIIGPNGAGKTTLLRIITGLVKPSSGRVRICGYDSTGNPLIAGRCIGYVPQRPPLSRYNPMTVYDFLSSRTLFSHRWPRRARKRDIYAKVNQVIAETGLSRDVLEKRLWELSGGELMRVFIARTLLHDPKILLLDEPLAPIDPQGKIEFSHLLGRLSDEKLVVVTSHDPLLLEKYTDLMILLNRRVYAIGSPEDVLRKTVLAKVYGGAIVEVEKHIHIVDEHGGGRK